MKVLKQFILEEPEVIFDSDEDQGTITIELEDDFILFLTPTVVNNEQLLEVMLQAKERVARLIVYPQTTNVIRLGGGRL